MNYEFLAERARQFARSNMCVCDSRSLNQMADALENQEKLIAGLQEIIERQCGVNFNAVNLALELDAVKAELAEEKHRFDRLSDFEVAEAEELERTKKLLEMARAERDAVTRRMIELEQELAAVKAGQHGG